MSTWTIIHEDSNGRKTKWESDGDSKSMEVITAFFGQGREIKPRNPYGPNGLPDHIKRERLLNELAKMEANPKKNRAKSAA